MAPNAGLTRPSPKYVAIHDDDDRRLEFLERTVAALEESGALMCTTRIRSGTNARMPMASLRCTKSELHDSLPSVGLQFLFRTNRADWYSLPPVCTS